MAITGMMYTGLSGLTSTARSINVTGDNIANLNTVGYRGSRAMFEDVLSRSIPGVGELGGGTTVAQIEKLFHQGPIVSSPKPEDIAISGRGFFVVAGLNDGVDGTFYTRAGNFNVDNQGYLSTNGGLRVQGYAPTDGIAGSRLQDVRLERSIEPSATTRMQMTVNFDGQTMTTTPVPFDPANPGQTSAFSQDTIVYDSRGTAHEVTAYFTRTGQDTWQWNLMADSDSIDGGSPTDDQTVVARGTLTFDTSGQLTAQTVDLNGIDFENAAADQQIEFAFDGSTNAAIGTDAEADDSTVIALEQNGFQAGSYVGMQVTEDGTLVGRYDNGQQVTMARLAMADFANQAGLSRAGGTLFSATRASGEAVVGFAGAGGRGAMLGNSLEQSNVDLSEEFVKLITDQRGYQAQSRTITTADELLTETVNLKR